MLVQKVVQNRFKIHVIENDDCVTKLTKKQVAHLQEKSKVQQVQIRFELQLKKIFLIGDIEDVSSMITEIMKLFSRIETEKSMAKSLQKRVIWKWQGEDGEYNIYNYVANYTIEFAYQTFQLGGSQVFTYKNQTEEMCMINFNTKKELRSDGSSFTLKRATVEELIDLIYKGSK